MAFQSYLHGIPSLRHSQSMFTNCSTHIDLSRRPPSFGPTIWFTLFNWTSRKQPSQLNALKLRFSVANICIWPDGEFNAFEFKTRIGWEEMLGGDNKKCITILEIFVDHLYFVSLFQFLSLLLFHTIWCCLLNSWPQLTMRRNLCTTLFWFLPSRVFAMVRKLWIRTIIEIYGFLIKWHASKCPLCPWQKTRTARCQNLQPKKRSWKSNFLFFCVQTFLRRVCRMEKFVVTLFTAH